MHHMLVERIFIYVVRRYIMMAAFCVDCVSETVVGIEEVSKQGQYLV